MLEPVPGGPSSLEVQNEQPGTETESVEKTNDVEMKILLTEAAVSGLCLSTK